MGPGTSRAVVIAHRGASFAAPEHTIAAYDLAIAQGADYIELDVARTSDGVLIVLHDATLDRTLRGAASDCTGRAADRTYAQIHACDAGSWFNSANPSRASPAFAALRTLTLGEALDRYAGDSRLYIEIKDPDLYPGIEVEIAALLVSRGITSSGSDGVPRVYIQSFSGESLARFRAAAPAFPRIFLMGDVTEAAAIVSLEAIAAFADGIGPRAASVGSSLVDAARARCLVVHPYTVNDRAEMLSLLELGVDGILTDRPDVARDVLASMRPASGNSVRSCAS